MMRFQCRSLLAFFLLVSASLAKEESVAEHVQTSRHKGRSHKTTSAWSASSLSQAASKNLRTTQAGWGPFDFHGKFMAFTKYGLLDSDSNRMVSFEELVNNYDDVGGFMATSMDQTQAFHFTMDDDIRADDAGYLTVEEDEFRGFESVMLEDYDDMFDAIATQEVEFLTIFGQLDGNSDQQISLTEWLAKAGSYTATEAEMKAAFKEADIDNDGEVSFQELIDDHGRDMLWIAVIKKDESQTLDVAEWKALFGGRESSEKLHREIDEFTLTAEEEAAGGDDAVIDVEEFKAWSEGNGQVQDARDIDGEELAIAQEITVLPARGADGLKMENIDGDGDNDCDREEFMTFSVRVAGELKDEFRSVGCDSDRNRQLSKSEIVTSKNAACPLPAMDAKLFDFLDADNNGQLDYSEFMTSFSELVALTGSTALALKGSYFPLLWKTGTVIEKHMLTQCPDGIDKKCLGFSVLPGGASSEILFSF